MKIKKTDKTAEGKMAAIRARLPGTASVQIEDDGKLAAQVTAWVPSEEDGKSYQHQVILTDGDIERLLAALANPDSPGISMAVSKLMRENLRNILRLSSLGVGTSLTD